MFNTTSFISQYSAKDIVQQSLLDGMVAESYKEKLKKIEERSKSYDDLANDMTTVRYKNEKEQLKNYLFETCPSVVSKFYLDNWVDKNDANKDIKDGEELKKKIKEIDDKLYKDIDGWIESEQDNIDRYLELHQLLGDLDQPSDEQVKTSIMLKGKEKFDEQQQEAMNKKKELIKQMRLDLSDVSKLLDQKYKIDEMRQKIAEVPIEIENTINDIKKLLDTLLGKTLSTLLDPMSTDFDIAQIVKIFQSMLEPLLNVIKPIEDVVGKVPVLGDLMAIMKIMQNSGGGKQLTKEEIKKILGDQLPELNVNIKETADGIMTDIMVLCMKLQMMMISLIFEMINVIYSKLKIITQVIPLGALKPLDLITNAIDAVPLIWQFITNGGGLMYDAVTGLVRQKYAEAMALSIPNPFGSPEFTLEDFATIEEKQSVETTKPAVKQKTYNEVLQERTEKYKELGFNRTDLTRILNQYKAIYNGGEEQLTKYSVNLGVKDPIKTLTKTTVSRKPKATPEGFESYLDNLFKQPADFIKNNGVAYEELCETEVVCGAEYQIYKDLIKKREPAKYIIVEEWYKPSIFGI